jgi:DNA-binding transcriptional ArsR family regulator
MNDSRHVKDLLYEQVARIGKAASSPKRLELIELLCQGEKSVETLAREAAVSVKLASAHLRELRAARLVETEKQGKYVIYRIANREVAGFWVAIRSLAEDRLVELRNVIEQMVSHPTELAPQDRDSLVKMARKGDVVVLDVRPSDEFLAAQTQSNCCARKATTRFGCPRASPNGVLRRCAEKVGAGGTATDIQPGYHALARIVAGSCGRMEGSARCARSTRAQVAHLA